MMDQDIYTGKVEVEGMSRAVGSENAVRPVDYNCNWIIVTLKTSECASFPTFGFDPASNMLYQVQLILESIIFWFNYVKIYNDPSFKILFFSFYPFQNAI